MSFDEKQNIQTNYFNHLVSSDARREAMQRAHNAQWRKLGGQENSAKQSAKERVKASIDKRMEAHRAEFANRRADLKSRQANEKADLRDRWQQRNKERRTLIDIAAKHQQTTQKQERAAHERDNGITVGVIYANRTRNRPEPNASVKGAVANVRMIDYISPNSFNRA